MSQSNPEKPALLDRVINTGMGRIAASKLLTNLQEDERNQLESADKVKFYGLLQSIRQAVIKRAVGTQIKGKP